MGNYYEKRLSAERLRRCYEIAPERVRRYLEAEIRFVQSRLRPEDSVLELGCGYGRVAHRLAEIARRVVGIDTAEDSLALARESAPPGSRCEFLKMNALALSLPPEEFDLVACVQNGICAFGVDQRGLIAEAVRVTRPGGTVLFSTYAEGFWPHRLRWFELQAEAGLIGAIDYEATGDGTIACEDGFRAGALLPERMSELCGSLGLPVQVTEVEGASVFFEILV